MTDRDFWPLFAALPADVRSMVVHHMIFRDDADPPAIRVLAAAVLVFTENEGIYEDEAVAVRAALMPLDVTAADLGDALPLTNVGDSQ